MQDITIKVTLTHPVTYKREEREVTFVHQLGGYYSEKIFAAQIGKGKKAHGTEANLVAFANAEAAAKLGWRKADFIAEDGSVYFFNNRVSIRNSHAYIIGWADQYEDVATKQTYYGSLK